MTYTTKDIAEIILELEKGPARDKRECIAWLAGYFHLERTTSGKFFTNW